jgi:hypothetical protein
MSGLSFPQGFFSYTVNHIPTGSNVTVTITLPSSTPVGTQAWKCVNGTWINCAAILGDNDGDNILTLTLTDGGLYDADGLANGVIVDPVGFSVAVVIGPTPPLLSPPHGGSMPNVIAPTPPVQLPNVFVQQATISASEVAPDSLVYVTATIANKGSVNGNAVVKLIVNGEEESRQSLSVASGNTIPVTFTVQRSQPGIYNVTVNNTSAGSFTVSDNSTILYVSIACLFLAFVLGVILIYRRFVA